MLKFLFFLLNELFNLSLTSFFSNLSIPLLLYRQSKNVKEQMVSHKNRVYLCLGQYLFLLYLLHHKLLYLLKVGFQVLFRGLLDNLLL